MSSSPLITWSLEQTSPADLLPAPAFRGRRIGGHLLSYGTARAWDLAERWPRLPPTKRVWLHTCTRDGAHAMGNYLRRGFRLFDTKVTEEADTGAPGPWSGAVVPPA